MSVKLGFGVMTAALLLGTVAFPAAAQSVPSYAHNEESIHGVVSTFDGKYDLDVRDARGYVDHVEMHDGTVINPTGLTLHSGMSVKIYGHADGARFVANEIDTPYHYAYPAYGYAPYPAAYPYAVYGGFYGRGPYFRGRVGFWF